MTQEIYSPANVPLYEAMYGSGLISLGGYEAVDRMFEGLPLLGKKLLDVGSGIGGMANYLAQKYGAHVTGLEIHPWMAEYGQNHTPANIKDHVNFVTYTEEGLIPISDECIDMVYSKGVLTHVSDKKSLFQKIYPVLKPGAQLCLIDWIVPEIRGPQNEMRASGEISSKETQTSYEKILEDCGFQDVIFENESDVYLGYVKNLGALLESSDHKRKFASVIEPNLRDILLKSNRDLVTAIESGAQLSVRIQARKRS
ncbi:Methyltransferase domain-containing protein [Candidatus Bealeia paramacronuclearis]|uniref:Methyltransferase domain-containing protein n=1 Tax=Candidatus Bealeia paramacronuclearis TaxID=1921001 RepID=A0ABZ2C475_9PROT|nr:Methyltransferase domain-containing protein [Candidatus Bealeia paramacronuclearis]